MDRQTPLVVAQALVAERFPAAEQAWLAGSTVSGHATATSDLDVTVLLTKTQVRRESLTYDGWPVELFVHTEASVRYFVAKDVERRRPTMARLVAAGVPLLPGDAGLTLRDECAATIDAGPPPLSPAELDLMRYYLTDQLDDLAGATPGPVADAVAVEVWRLTAELLLATASWWSGGGKWLMREIETLDEHSGTDYARRLHEGLHTALRGSAEILTTVADAALAQAGGRLRAGYTQPASLPDTLD